MAGGKRLQLFTNTMTSTELQKLADSLHALSEKAESKIDLCEDRAFALIALKSNEYSDAIDCVYYFRHLQRELRSAFNDICDAVESLKFLESKGETL